MKKLTSLFSLALVALMLCLSSKGFAQGTDATPPTTTAPFKPYFAVGPYFTAGAAIFAGEVMETEKTGMQFAYTAGALGAYELSETFGITVGLGYQSRPIYFRDEQNADNWERKAEITYISIQPGVKFGAFMVGVDFNMPGSITITDKGEVPPPIDASMSGVTDDDLATVIDIRLGALIPLTKSKSSELNFFIQGAFGLTSAIENQKFTKGDNVGDDRTFPVGTLQGGLCYTFNLGR